MAKCKPYNYSQNVMVPVSLEDQLMPGTLEFAIRTLVEDRMDTSIFDDRYDNDATGRWAYDPKVLLKVVLFGCSRGLISSRRMERACRENITFMALTCGQCPDHSTIAAFVSSSRYVAFKKGSSALEQPTLEKDYERSPIEIDCVEKTFNNLQS